MHLQRCNAGVAVLLRALGSCLSLALRLAHLLLERLHGFPAALLPLLQAHKLLLQPSRPGRRLQASHKCSQSWIFASIEIHPQALQGRVTEHIELHEI